MEVTSAQFYPNAVIAIHDIQLQTALDRGTTRASAGRVNMMGETTDALALRAQARAARERALNNLPELLEQLEANVTRLGGVVLWARTGAEANHLIAELCESNQVKCITKGKSMVTEETGLNEALQARGIEINESDLGEYILQLRGDHPSHIVTPMIHMTSEQTAQTLHAKLGMPMTDSPEEMTRFVRGVMREKYLEADLGISGVNFAIAESGTIITVENEGNNRLSCNTPRIHVAVMGIEKVLATWEDWVTLAQLLPRSATGQRMNVYTNLFTGPKRPAEQDGPEKFYLVILDNGRSKILAGEYAESLACIRCGACLNACPVYQNVGGHAYGWVYPGPIGSIVSPLLLGVTAAPMLPHASTLCGACQQACPVDIAIPEMLLKLRRDLVQQGDGGWGWKLSMRLWQLGMQSPALYRFGGALASLATRALAGRSGKITWLPGILGGWTRNRDFAPFAARSFRARYAKKAAGRVVALESSTEHKTGDIR